MATRDPRVDAYIAKMNYSDLSALVAFSGTVTDKGLPYTEPQMNGFPESQTAKHLTALGLFSLMFTIWPRAPMRPSARLLIEAWL